MFTIEVEDAAALIKITWLGQVDADEMGRCVEEVDVKTTNIPPGFRVLADMTNLESMDLACAPYLGSLMDLCVAKEVGHVVRVIPDPRKDIGLNIMSSFRYGPKVRVTVCEDLSEAIRQLAE
jgi:hypothetical protein